jgi:hypothetical protein
MSFAAALNIPDHDDDPSGKTAQELPDVIDPMSAVRKYAQAIFDASTAIGNVDGGLGEDIGRVSPNLKPEIQQAQRDEARQAAVQRAEPHRQRLAENLQSFREQGEHYTPDAVRRSAVFHDDAHVDSAVRADRREGLRNTPVGELEGTFRAIAGKRDLAGAQLGLHEVERRVREGSLDRGHADAFRALLKRIPVPEANEYAELARRVDLAATDAGNHMAQIRGGRVSSRDLIAQGIRRDRLRE